MNNCYSTRDYNRNSLPFIQLVGLKFSKVHAIIFDCLIWQTSYVTLLLLEYSSLIPITVPSHINLPQVLQQSKAYCLSVKLSKCSLLRLWVFTKLYFWPIFGSNWTIPLKYKKASICWQDSARRQFQAGGTYRRRTLIDGYLESPFPTTCLLYLKWSYLAKQCMALFKDHAALCACAKSRQPGTLP